MPQHDGISPPCDMHPQLEDRENAVTNPPRRHAATSAGVSRPEKNVGMARRPFAFFLALVLVASLFQGYGAMVGTERAQATYATGGSGLHRGSIDWFEWGTPAQTIPARGVTKTNTRTIAGRTVVTTCTIAGISGSLQAYRPGTWSGDGLDDLYNVGGTGTSNQIIAGLSNTTPAAEVSFNFSCGVTLDGVGVPLQGLVVADAEQSDTRNEYIEATPDQSGVTWRIIDRYRSPGCTNETTADLVNNTLRLWGWDITKACAAGPMAVGFMDGATSAKVKLKGAGKSAIALGVMLSSSDFGDAPESYGEAGALLATTWQGGTVPAVATKVSADSFALATQTQSVPRLGAIVDGEPTQLHSVDATGDDTFGSPALNPINDEDGVDPLGTIQVTPGGTYQKGVSCTGPGSVAGWIDWNRNGTFDPGERSGTATCTGSTATQVTLIWNVPTDTVSSLGANLSFMRLRIARDASQILLPTGTSTSGEVEDHKLNIALPRLNITKTSNASANPRPGDKITWTVKATNPGPTPFTAAYPARLLDDLTGVLDDATYNIDAVVTTNQSGLSYSSPRLSWTGALAAGASVTLTYSTTLKAGGDGTARNVAWQPDNPANAPAPACNAPVGGADATTGERCAARTVLLPKLSVTKTADRTELPRKGDKVTYTVTVTNSGPGTYTAAKPASATDDLTDVLDAATFDNNASASVGVVSLASNTLSWSGALASGQSATITYSVTYNAGGNQSLVNSVCVPVEERVQGGQGGCASVTVLGANLGTEKSVTSSDTPAEAGSILTYVLTFTNTGKSPASVDHEDILTGVVDDAVVAAPNASTGLTAVRVGDRFKITGSIPVNGSKTVTYTAKVNPEGTRGDNVADNFLVVSGQPQPGQCLTSDPNCTSTPLVNVTATKSADPATGSPVIAGQEIPYTLVITNSGQTTEDVDFTDYRGDVADDASLGDITIVPVGLLTAVVSGDTVRIRGSLEPSQTVTISYTAKVKKDTERAGTGPGVQKDLLSNVLAPTGIVGPVCGVGLVVCTQNPVSSWAVSKAATPASGGYVAPRDVVTYSVTATSVQGEIRDAVLTDDLTAVLDDANFIPGSATLVIAGGPATPVADPSGGSLTTGPFVIPSGTTAVLTYRVAVGTDAWSTALLNRISGLASNAGAEFRPTTCFPGDVSEDCSTNHLVKAHLFINKRGINGPVDGSIFEVHADVDGTPAGATGMVAPIVSQVGRFEASAFIPGKYFLVETRAPAGHTLLAKPVGFIINVDGTLTISGVNPQAILDPDDPLGRTIRVTDVAAIPMPRAGGGAVNFTVLVMVMFGIGAFGVALIRRQRPQRPPLKG